MGLVFNACYPFTWEIEAGGSEIQVTLSIYRVQGCSFLQEGSEEAEEENKQLPPPIIIVV